MANDKVIGEILKGFSDKNIETAINSLSHLENPVPSFKISYFVTDENTKKYIKDLGLDNPQKLAMFFVDLGFATVEGIVDSVNEIQNSILIDHFSKLKSIKQKIKHTICSEGEDKRLSTYQDELIDLRNIFEGRVQDYIKRIIQIDRMNSFERNRLWLI